MRQLSMLAALTIVVAATAQNPIIHDQYTADPTARVFNNKVYLFPSHDIPAPAGQRQEPNRLDRPRCNSVAEKRALGEA